ncbi:hypothetical protein F4823DRAFT_190241 [Ustulina deusta]|nr:hypothetical protein F4823DRAFT_190241 [Ustulina deusta]
MWWVLVVGRSPFHPLAVECLSMGGVGCLVLICHRPPSTYPPGPLRPHSFFAQACDRQSGRRICRVVSLFLRTLSVSLFRGSAFGTLEASSSNFLTFI